MIFLALATQDILVVRDMPWFFAWTLKLANGGDQDAGDFDDFEMRITHALDKDANSEIITYTDLTESFTVQKIFSIAQVNALPLGTFFYQIGVHDPVDNVWQVAYQGNITIAPTARVGV